MVEIKDFIQLLDDKAITYEVTPKKSASIKDILQNIKDFNIDKYISAFVCTDSPLAIMKHSAMMASIKMQKFLKKPAICTISMRDRNSLALSSEILGLNEFNVRLFLAVSGDKLQLGDQKNAKAVFEGSSIKIIELIDKLNNGFDLSDNKLQGDVEKIYCFSTLNSYAKNMNQLKLKMQTKIKSGTKAIFTQPIYDIETSKILHAWLDELNNIHGTKCVLMQGFFPALRYKNAKFLHDKLPGVFIPDNWLEKLYIASHKNADEELKIGLELNIALFKQLYEFSPKIHFMNHNNAKIASMFFNEI